jgi:hypothetical protein
MAFILVRSLARSARLSSSCSRQRGARVMRQSSGMHPHCAAAAAAAAGSASRYAHVALLLPPSAAHATHIQAQFAAALPPGPHSPAIQPPPRTWMVVSVRFWREKSTYSPLCS